MLESANAPPPLVLAELQIQWLVLIDPHIYMFAGHLSLNNIQAVDQNNRVFPDPPYKPVPTQGDAQADSSAASVDQLKADFNTLLMKLRASGALKQ